jgi:bifunctional DNA-binding transcriptional regulator/antitoxin component of YhaV-PrlF toxin-antitoxin module
MEATGIVRRIDELGRITLPIELIRTLGVAEKDPLEIFTDENKIILQKYESNKPVCAHCSETKDLQKVGKAYIFARNAH